MYYNARYYDPAIGRFLSADTIVPDPNNIQSFNRYTYVYNSPIKYSDPTGHFACFGVCIGGGILIGIKLSEVLLGFTLGAAILLAVGDAKVDDGKKGKRPPNKSPKGAGRRGGFREGKRQSGIPVSKLEGLTLTMRIKAIMIMGKIHSLQTLPTKQ